MKSKANSFYGEDNSSNKNGNIVINIPIPSALKLLVRLPAPLNLWALLGEEFVHFQKIVFLNQSFVNKLINSWVYLLIVINFINFFINIYFIFFILYFSLSVF